MLQLCNNVEQKSMPPEKEKKLWQPNRTKQNHGSVWLPGAEPGGGFTLVIFGLDQTQKSEPNKPSLKLLITHLLFLPSRVNKSAMTNIQISALNSSDPSLVLVHSQWHEENIISNIKLEADIFAQTAPTHGDISPSYFTLRTKSRVSAASVSPAFVSETAW